MQNDVKADVSQAPGRTSLALQVMLHPYRTYAALKNAPTDARATPAWRVALRGPAMWLLMLTAFVSLTTAGRLVWFHIAFVGIFWLYFPGLAALWVGVASHRRGEPLKNAATRIDRYFLGYAPWYLWMLFVGGLCIFAPHTRVAIYGMGIWFALPLVVAIGWGGVTTHACFRAGFGFGRWQAIARMGGFYVGLVGSLVAYYWATDQLRNLTT